MPGLASAAQATVQAGEATSGGLRRPDASVERRFLLDFPHRTT